MTTQVMEKNGRDQNGKFAPGHSISKGNGRPAKYKSWPGIIEEMLSSRVMRVYYVKDDIPKYMDLDTGDPQLSFKHVIISNLIKESVRGNVNAIRELLDRAIGKAPQTIINQQKEENEDLTRLSETELQEYLALKAKTGAITEE